MEKINIFNVKWSSKSAGPSPCGNIRCEIFLAGCKIAEEGRPCKNCFNSELWQTKACRHQVSIDDAYNQIKKFAPNKYITFVGGEPLDQPKALYLLCKKLKENNYHILVFTHYLKQELEQKGGYYKKVLDYIDILVDGPYVEDLRMFDETKENGFNNAIGSANQVIYDLNNNIGYKAGDLKGLEMKNDSLIYIRR